MMTNDAHARAINGGPGTTTQKATRKKIAELGKPSRRGRGIGDATKIAAEVIGNFMRHAGIVELPRALEDQMIRFAGSTVSSCSIQTVHSKRS